MTTFVLIRHGESLWNQMGVYQGQMDVPLSERGQAQAEAVAARLATERLEVIVSSPLRRAFATAMAIAAHQACPIETEPALAEIHHGTWQGLTVGEVRALFIRLWQTWSNAPESVRMPGPGGESVADVRDRVIPAVSALADRFAGQRVALVSHDLPLKIIVASALGTGLVTLPRLTIENCAISLVHWDLDQSRVLTLNDAHHLVEVRSALASQAL